MIDPWFTVMRVRRAGGGLGVVRIWLSDEDVIALKAACAAQADVSRYWSRGPSRFCGIPVTMCGDGQSRVVFSNWTSVPWSVVAGA